MRPRHLNPHWLGLVLGVVLVCTSGCRFNRTVTNTYHQDLDTSGIVVGESTWRDVLNTLGTPGTSSTEAMTTELPTLEYFRYVSTDIKTTEFLLAWWLFLPWRWVDEQSESQLMITFDDNGVVSNIFQSKDHSIWRPLQDEDDRPPREVKRSGGSS